MATETGLRNATHSFQRLMDIHRRAIDGVVREQAHPVDQIADTIRFLTDQPGQSDVVLLGYRCFEQLGRTANTGEWIFDLMRQNCCQTGHRSGRISVGDLAVNPPCNGLFVQRHNRQI